MALAGRDRRRAAVKDVVPEDLRMIRLVFERLGLQTELDGADLQRPRRPDSSVVERDVGDATAKVEDGPWPAFPADLTSIAVALATQSRGLGPRSTR